MSLKIEHLHTQIQDNMKANFGGDKKNTVEKQEKWSCLKMPMEARLAYINK